MKKLILSASFAFALLTTSNTFAQQGFGTNQPDKSAAVDIVSSKRGLLIPRISIADLDLAAPVNNPATSLFVYNTNTTTGVGFYYWDGTKWVRFVSTNNERDVVVQAAANGNIDIPTATYDANGVKTYNVSVKGGDEGQVLVSNAAGGTEWTDPNTFVLDVLTAGNAIGIATDAIDPTKIEVKFNGTLTENTTIATGAHNLAITGLTDVATADLIATDRIVIMDANGVLKITSKAALLDTKNLTSTEGIITLNGTPAANNSVLTGVELGVADRSIAPAKFKATIADEGKVPVVKNDGTVDWKTIPGTSAATLTTDGKIVIGDNTSVTQTLGNAVLVATELSIKQNSLTATEIATGAVTSDEILNGTIQTVDIASTGNSQVLVTQTDGTVAWIKQSDLANKDNYIFAAPLVKVTGAVNATGGTNYDVSVATATTDLGVVKQAAANAEVTITNGVLGLDKAEIGKALTSTSITVPANKALLEAVNIEITPGTEGQILTTVGAAGAETTAWTTVNSLVEVDTV